MGQLFLRNKADVDGLLNVVGDHGLAMTREAVEYARDILSDDWLILFAIGQNCICNLSIGKSGTVGLALPQWAEVVESLYALRGAEGIAEQARRLRVPAHERLDTAFAVTVAGRYKYKSWSVAFEPNGKGCSDLQLVQENKTFYVEVKRENIQDHVRANNFRANATAILNALLPSLSEWLEKNDCRIQVKFPRGLSQTLVVRILLFHRINNLRRINPCEGFDSHPVRSGLEQEHDEVRELASSNEDFGTSWAKPGRSRESRSSLG